MSSGRVGSHTSSSAKEKLKQQAGERVCLTNFRILTKIGINLL
jgi:hypothetical protein